MMTILVVDDIPDNRMAIELVLEDMPVRILSAENGVEAVSLCQTEQVELVLMDVMMPVMDGIEATSKIREFDKDVMIVAVSALDDEEAQKKMLRQGCEDYVRKPVESSVLKKRVLNYLELLELRQKKVYDNEAVNLFDKNVYNRFTQFRISNKESLAEFWEFFLTDDHKASSELSDCVRIIYALSLSMLKHQSQFTIYMEENKEHLYLTINGIRAIGEKVIRNILQRHFREGRFVMEGDKLSFMLDVEMPVPSAEVLQQEKEEPDSNLNEEEIAILRKSHQREKINAHEYVQNTPVSLVGKLEELEYFEDQIDRVILDFEKLGQVEQLYLLGNMFVDYASLIDELDGFRHLSYAIESFAKILQGMDEGALNEEKSKKLIIFLSGILEDLCSWRKTIFINQDAEDIHYMDSSMLNSCLQVEMALEDKKEDEDDGGDIELF